MEKESSQIRIGPGWCQKGNKRMMLMTPPIVAFDFGMEGLLKNLQSNSEINIISPEFQNLFNSALNSLISDVLIYMQNRIGLMLGKEISLTSVPAAKSALSKYFSTDINTIIGDKGYQELKKLDEDRGKTQHKNDRYIRNCKVNKTVISSIKDLVKYTKKIKAIIKELDNKLEKIKPLYEVTTSVTKNQVSIQTKAIGHSFDLNKMKINKKQEKN